MVISGLGGSMVLMEFEKGSMVISGLGDRTGELWDLRGKAIATEQNAFLGIMGPKFRLKLSLRVLPCTAVTSLLPCGPISVFNNLAHYDTWLEGTSHSLVAIVSHIQNTPRDVQKTQGPCLWIRTEVYLDLCALEVSLGPFLEPDTSRDYFLNYATRFHIQTNRPGD
ncbi:hypothetical protein VNO77_19800 [Canavalia gladiata]|uniref:Uncharacterized protein n=1 Tax=Canavalia gladiata TaxID=3824 RepID=A0AAN9LND1_CANGL